MLTLKMTPKSVQNQPNCSHETNLISKPLGNRLFNFKSILDSFWISGNGNVLGENALGGPLMHNAITGLSRRFKSGSLLNQPFGPKLQTPKPVCPWGMEAGCASGMTYACQNPLVVFLEFTKDEF